MKSIIVISVVCGIMLLSACSQSGRRQPNTNNENVVHQNKPTKNWSGRTVIKMEKRGGVYQVPIEINETKMYFIFDTGASMVSISETEAKFLFKQGTLDKSDILGKANFMDANGDISKGTIINLKTVKIGNRTLTNIRASVVHNMNAPLLLGQTVLEEFGKVTIDYNKGNITLE